MKTLEFTVFLSENMSRSSHADRQKWIKKVIDKRMSIISLIDFFLIQNKNITNRFLWMLSDLGQISPPDLLEVLPYLLSKRHTIKIKNIEATFANYFLLVGVPLVNESEVIDLMFKWILSKDMNVTTKSRSIVVLDNLVKKYPELKNEFRLCLEDQLEKHTKSFDKKVRHIIISMN